MRTLALIVTLLIISSSAQAQNLIAVQKGNNVTFYTAVDSAIYHAADGDTLYVPGGSFDVSNMTITKQLYIFGAGYNPDSTKATNFTFLSGNLTIASGSKGGLLTGCVLCTVSLDTTSNYTFSRCNIGTILFTRYGGASNNYFIENVIGKVNGGGTTDNNFLNNFIGILSNFSSNNIFNHNIISGSYSNCSGSGNTQNVADSVSGSSFENNILMGQNFLANNCNVVNNYFVNGRSSLFIPSSNISSNNLHQDFTSTTYNNYVFVKCSFSLTGNYSYSDDYHLISTCPGKNAAIDGTDIGIYGGQFPWKDGAIPVNPHIQQSVISGTTDANGNLKVNIQVEAQDH